jgi:oligopeptide transport system substrate-binding protein
MNTNNTVTRRAFLKMAGITAGAATLAACTPQVVTQIVQQTQIIAQTQMATSVVKQTQIVEVTPTLPPAIVTPQGRTLPLDAAPLAKQIFTSDYGIEPKFFDGIRDIYSQAGLQMINSTLVHNDENMILVPNLAESWKPGPESRYWEFVIQKDAVWSDGTPVTADDIVYTIVHLADPIVQNPWMWFFYPIMGVTEFNGGKFPQSVVDDPKTGGVRKVDDRTVRIYGQASAAGALNPEGDPTPYLPALLSYQASVFVPKALVIKDPLHWADNGVGLLSGGPWICTEWVHSVSITYDINPKYNLPFKAGMQKVITPIGIANVMTAFLNQEIDYIHSLAAAGVAQIRADAKLNPMLHFFSWFQTQWLQLNTFMPPLDNLKLRQALAKSIDRQTMVSTIDYGMNTAGYSMLPPGFPAYNPELDSIQAFDVAAAQQLLTDAGYKGGVDPKTGKPLVVIINDAGVSARLVYVKQQWETNLGISVNLKANESGVWGNNRAKHLMSIFSTGYEYDYVDPYDLLTMLFHSDPNSAASNKTDITKWGAGYYPWYNADFDKACEAAGSETDSTKRIADFQTAEKILVTDCASIFMAHQVMFQIWWPWILGIKPDKSGNLAFRFLDATTMQIYVSKDVDALKAQYKNA